MKNYSSNKNRYEVSIKQSDGSSLRNPGSASHGAKPETGGEQWSVTHPRHHHFHDPTTYVAYVRQIGFSVAPGHSSPLGD
jgi:hypothetical protein